MNFRNIKPFLRTCVGAILFLTFAGSPLFAEGQESNRKPSLFEQEHLSGNWLGLRDKMNDKGVDWKFAYTAQVLGNPIGGLSNGVVYDGLLEMALDIDFKKLLGIPQLSFHVNSFLPHGRSLSKQNVGDLANVNNIDFVNSIRLYELWLDETLFDGALSLRVGQIAEDSEFSLSDTRSYFLNAAFGALGTLSANMPVPIYAIPAPGARIRFEPKFKSGDSLYLQAAIFDGNPDPATLGDYTPGSAVSTASNLSGLVWNFSKDEGFFLIGEMGLRIGREDSPKALRGTYLIGAAFHSDTFADIYDKTLIDRGASFAPAQSRSISQNFSFYASAEQMIFKEASGDNVQGLSLAGRIGYAPSDRNHLNLSVEIALGYQGLIPHRDLDFLGVSFARYFVSSRVADAVRQINTTSGTSLPLPDAETIFELTYTLKLAPWISLQPDFQYVVHPGGSSSIPDAFVIGLRGTVLF